MRLVRTETQRQAENSSMHWKSKHLNLLNKVFILILLCLGSCYGNKIGESVTQEYEQCYSLYLDYYVITRD